MDKDKRNQQAIEDISISDIKNMFLGLGVLKNSEPSLSLNDLTDILSACNVSINNVANMMLNFKGGMSRCISVIYTFMRIKLDKKLSSYLELIMPSSKKNVKFEIKDICAYLKLEEGQLPIVKDILGYYELRAYRIGIIDSIMINTQLNESPYHSLYDLIKETQGTSIKYTFRCAICQKEHSNGYCYEYGGRKLDICKFCVSEIQKRTETTKLIYTPMGNKR